MDTQRPERPNLFKYGRKELSQDAMICWLLAWADERYAKVSPDLHKAGQNFAKALFCKHERPGPKSIHKVELEQQASGIDVLAWINGDLEGINGKYALLIEDKTDSHEHSEQLGRYHKLVLDGEAWVGCKPIKPSEDRFFPIFLKTGNMSRADKAGVEARKLEPRYKVFERGDFLGVLKECDRGVSEIMDDFFNHLQKRERDSSSWESTPPTDWSRTAWEGFYRRLEEELGPHIETDNITDINWKYVPNQAGGFLGFWRYDYDADSGDEVYWQAEREKLCFKISVGGDGSWGERRWHWHERIVQAGESERMLLKKPARFGSGKTMTVAILNGDWRRSGSDGRLDLEKTVEVLNKAERVLQAAVSKDSHG